MHFDGADEDFEPRKRRRCRTSKKKRLRLKQRTSLEPNEQQPERHQSENNQQLADKTREQSETQETEPSQAPDTQESKPQRQQEHPEPVEDKPEHEHGDGDNNDDDDGDDEEMTEYERKRRTNILRNQAWMQQLGFSAAKLAVRTAIGTEATKSTTKRPNTTERQTHRAAEQPPQPLRKSKRVRRATEVMNVARQPTRSYHRQKTNVASKRFFYHEESESELSSYEGDSTEEEDGESTEEEEMEEASDESGTEEDEMDEPTHGSEEGDSRPEEHAPSTEPPTEPLVEPKAQPFNDQPAEPQDVDSPDNKPRAEANQAETKQPWTGSALQNGESHSSSANQASKRDILDDTKNNSALGELADVERKRRENVLRNQAFMQQVGVSITKLAAHTSIGDEAGKEARRQELAAKRALKAAQRAKLSSQPVRKSRRQAGEEAILGHQPALNYSLELLSMRTKGNSAVHLMDAVDNDGKTFLKNVASSSKIPSAFEIDSVDDEVEYSLAKNDAVKVVPFRTTSMAFLPRADRIFLACGDKEGHIGFWSPSERVNDTTGSNTPSPAALCRPHGFTVSQIVFPDLSTMLSSSFHGIVREFDLHTAESLLVCDINAEAGISSLITSSPQAFYAGCSDGKMRLVDRRARGMQRYELHEGSINSLDRHPTLTYCIATASSDRTVCLWDTRRLSSHMSIPLTTIPHATIVDCAHFSPHDGNWLVSVTGEDSHINMIDTSILTKRNESDPLPIPLPSPIRIYHKGFPFYDTGYTRVAWDPKRRNRFIIGCVGAPPRIKIFRAHRPARELRSATFTGKTFVNVFHPYVDVIASGGASGRISLWRGNAKEK